MTTTPHEPANVRDALVPLGTTVKAEAGAAQHRAGLHAYAITQA